MSGGRGRAAYAYRDLDEDVFFPPVEHAYHSQESPVPVAKPLSESVILRSHFDKTRTRRRRLLCIVGGGLLLLAGSSALLLLTKSMEVQHHRSPLELAISAPYGALRGKGDVKPSLRTPFDGELETLSSNDPDGPDVGDVDLSDVRTHEDVKSAEERTEEDDESDLYYYGGGDDEEETEDRPWRGPQGYIKEEAQQMKKLADATLA